MDLDLQLGELRRALTSGGDVFAIHYACEGFNDATDHPPGVSAIVACSVPVGDESAFSVTDHRDKDRAELEMLVQYTDWLRQHADARLVHWNMNNAEYGFEAIQKRLAFIDLGAEQFRPADDRTHDLDDLLEAVYGDDFVDHPRLPSLLALNGIETRFSLSGREQGERYRAGQHGELLRCTSERARNLVRLTELLLNGQLQTKSAGPRVEYAGAMLDSVTVVVTIGARLRDVARELGRRHGDRDGVSLVDEYDYQDVFRSLLRVHFRDVRPEDYVPTYAGGNSRVDFVLPEVGVAVELKVARATLKDGQVGEQLLVDRARYATREDVRHLVCLVFDYEGFITNPAGLERDLSTFEDNVATTVRIYR